MQIGVVIVSFVHSSNGGFVLEDWLRGSESAFGLPISEKKKCFFLKELMFAFKIDQSKDQSKCMKFTLPNQKQPDVAAYKLIGEIRCCD